MSSVTLLLSPTHFSLSLPEELLCKLLYVSSILPKMRMRVSHFTTTSSEQLCADFFKAVRTTSYVTKKIKFS